MYVNHTAQDFEIAHLADYIAEYKGSDDFKRANLANLYFTGHNWEISQKTILKANVIRSSDSNGRTTKHLQNREVPGNRISDGFLFRFVVQENQHLLGNGVSLAEDGLKQKLGVSFDTKLAQIGEKALLHGVCWGFWNLDHIEILPAAVDALSGFFALVDEISGVPTIGIQFWQLRADKPLMVRLFEHDGVTIYRLDNGKPVVVSEKKAYKNIVYRDMQGEVATVGENYAIMPVVPMYANTEKQSEFTDNIKSKIDLYDRIFSDFGDNLDRANDVYWVLNNFGGGTDDILEMLDVINKVKAVMNRSDGSSGATAEPKTLEVPYEARKTALELLRKALYADFMALDITAMTGGSLTNVAIEAAMTDLNLKCDRFEWQVFAFVQSVLRLIGIETEGINFVRSNLINKSEIVQDIYNMRSDIDRETALKLNPYINPDDIDTILANLDAEDVSGLDSMDELQAEIDRTDVE